MLHVEREEEIAWCYAEIDRVKQLYMEAEIKAAAHLNEIERLRAALERKQRPEAETIDGVIAWIKEDADRLSKTHAALGEKE